MSHILKKEKVTDTLNIEISEHGIAFREFIDYDDNSYLMFNWEELDKLIILLQKIVKDKE